MSLETDWERLARAAWLARKSAHLVGQTAVGAAILASNGSVYAGCNVEHRFRCHDVHAEVNALTTMIASGGGRATAIIVVAERERFTPCGGCLDWIFELGGQECLVGFQREPGGSVELLVARELMPHYPR